MTAATQLQPVHEATLADTIAEFLTEYRGNPKTRDYYHFQIELPFLAFANEHGITWPEEVTPQHIRDYLDGQRLGTYERGGKKKRQPETIHHRFRTLSRFFNWCVKQGYLADNPCSKVRAPSVPEKVKQGFTPDECKRLFAEARNSWGWLGARDLAILMIMVDTGCRAGGLLGLTEGSIVRGQVTRLRLREKGDRERFVPLGPRTVAALNEYIRRRPDIHIPGLTRQEQPLWLTVRKRPMTYSALYLMLNNVGRYAGIDNIHPHRFRHTFAALHYTEHRDMLALRNLLGHTRFQTTERYLGTLGHAYGTNGEYGTPTSFIS